MRSIHLQIHPHADKSSTDISSLRKYDAATFASYCSHTWYGLMKLGARRRIISSCIAVTVILIVITAIKNTTLPVQLIQSWRRIPKIRGQSSSTSSSTVPGLNVDKLGSCSNAIIFSGARQGSTWFVDSIENCTYSHEDPVSRKRLFAHDVFRRTELWKHFGEPHLDGSNLSPREAVQYVVKNSSVKIFPSVFWRRRDDVVAILKMRSTYNLSVIILRRDVDAAWRSWLKALTSKTWNGSPLVNTTSSIANNDTDTDSRNGSNSSKPRSTNTSLHTIIGDSDINPVVTSLSSSIISTSDANPDTSYQEEQQAASDLSHNREFHLRDLYRQAKATNPTANWTNMSYREHYMYFIESRARYDRGVEQLLKQLNIPYDVFDYDKVREQPAIVARNNQCWIRNCNFYKIKDTTLHSPTMQHYVRVPFTKQSAIVDTRKEIYSLAKLGSVTSDYSKVKPDEVGDEAAVGEDPEDDVVF